MSKAATLLPLGKQNPWLAPLAGFSDLAFRMVCRELGCSFAFTEMVSAAGLVYNSQGTLNILKTTPKDFPLAVQLFGSKPAQMFQATQFLKAKNFTFFDLNCGCPVKKVVKTGSGARLLEEPKKIIELVKAMGEVVDYAQIGVKTRLGYHLGEDVYLSLAEQLAKLNIGWFTLHPRYAKQKFSGKADWKKLKILKKEIPELKVIGSGDLLSAQDGLACLESTGIDGIMFARGALANPYIFTEFKLLSEKKSSSLNKIQIITKVLKLSLHYYRTLLPQISPLKMRTILPKLVKGLPEAKKIRLQLTQISSWEEIEDLILSLEKGGQSAERNFTSS